MTRVLVVGKGFLGKSIVTECEKYGYQTFGTHYNVNSDKEIKLDITNIESISKCIQHIKPDLIINCAAKTQVDLLENDPETAFITNAYGAKNIAKISATNNIRVIHISTDSVFDGSNGKYSENDIPNPVNIYGKSKLLGEKLVKENSENHVIVRTNFYGHNETGNSLFDWILNRLRQKNTIYGFSDIIFTPLEISNLSKMILEVSDKKYTGIIHIASDEPISKYQFAIKIAEAFNLNSNLIKKISVDEYAEFVAKRPKNTSLSNEKAKKLLSTTIVTLNEWLYNMKERV